MRAQYPGLGNPRPIERPIFGGDTSRGDIRFEPEDGSGERFRLDRANQCLWREVGNGPDRQLLLPPRTLAVLRHLLDRAGCLVTLDEFLDSIWPGGCVQPEVLKSQILALRSLLEDDAKKPRFIETLPRRGYRFIARLSSDGAGTTGTDAQAPTVTLVGRGPPLSQLRQTLHRVMSRRQREIVFVTGESGIGKTSLVDEFLRRTRLELPAARLALCQCVEGYGAKEPYYPVLEALRNLCVHGGRPQLQRELASCAPSWLAQLPGLGLPGPRPARAAEPGSGMPDRMPRELISFLERVATEAPLVVVFEDLQWADPATLSLIEALARTRTPMPLMLIGTYRADELLSGDHPLRGLRRDLQLHGLCTELPVAPLTACEIALYLKAQASGAAPPEGLADLIYRHTEGNPLFMVTLLEHLSQRALLSKTDSAWQLHAPLYTIEFEVPETLREMIEARIARLSTDEQRLLEAASIVGVQFDPSFCAIAAQLDPEHTEELCQALAQRHGVLRPARGDAPSRDHPRRYEFAHAMYREVLYRRQLPVRRAVLASKVEQARKAEHPVEQPHLAPVSSTECHPQRMVMPHASSQEARVLGV